MTRSAPLPPAAPASELLTLERQAARFALKFACEDCVHFAAETAACAHGYPTAPHRSRPLAPRPGADLLPIVFCKEFELA
jgi:hypothetical protein